MLLTGPVAGDPDPTGERVKAVRRALAEQPHIEAFFWDFPSLFQNPRSSQQDAAFKRALKVVRAMALEFSSNALLRCDTYMLRGPANISEHVCEPEGGVNV